MESVRKWSSRSPIKPISRQWMYIKPDAQFVINPGGTQDLGNALVIGGRVSVNF